jgi:multidrug efflux pump subunit AcrB
MTRFFVDRPVFACVLSIVIVIAGLVCLGALPIAQYPPIVPPTIQVTATYPGGSALTVAEAVGEPIEEQVTGVPGMIYMSSTCTNNGFYSLTVSFEVGTDVNTALMMVQTRTQLAMPQLPDSVQKQGVNVKIQSPNILLAVNLYSPDGRYDPTFLSNYAQITIFDELANIPGIALVNYLGQRQYSVRAWLDPQKVAALGMTAGEVMDAIRGQNVVVAPGNIGQQPVPKGQDYQLVLNTLGRLSTLEQFGEIVVKAGRDGRIVYLRDVARLELGAQNSDLDCTLSLKKDGKAVRYPSVALTVFALPSANALETADRVHKKMEDLKKRFPQGVAYTTTYDTTPYIKQSVSNVVDTIYIAVILVIIVIMVFLQDWRAMLLPMINIVVSLIGTFVVMKLLGFSLNNLSLFALVLAVGIVVDDSIVVVENIERWMGMGLPPREATIKAMDEITGPVIGISLVLAAVFVPTAFIPGLTGEFFRQFALTIATSALISAVNALSISPALAVLTIKPHGEGHEAKDALPRAGIAFLLGVLTYSILSPVGAQLAGAAAGGRVLTVFKVIAFLSGLVAGWVFARRINHGLAWAFGYFNKAFDLMTGGYTHAVGWALRHSILVLVVFGGLLGLTYYVMTSSPAGFIPDQDQGYLIVAIELPDSASVQRTSATMARLNEIAMATPGVDATMAGAGFSALYQCDSSNWGTMFVVLEPFERRTTPETQAVAVIARLNAEFYKQVPECRAIAFGAPPVPGLGQSSGFQLQIQDRTGLGVKALGEATETIVRKANSQPELVGVFSPLRANTPQLYLEIDREAALQMGVSLHDVFTTLNANMGSMYVNQFNKFGRIWQVNVQAEGRFRRDASNLSLLQVRNRLGQLVPLSAIMRVRDDSGPVFLMRYKDLNSAAVNGSQRPGVSSGQAMKLMEQICDQNLPDGMGHEWTNISYQQDSAAKSGAMIPGAGIFLPMVVAIFGLAVLMIFLVLAALYESWSLPFGIILVVPMCLLCSVVGLVWIARKPIDIFSQIGFVVLVALAAKNAILIVEYAVAKRKEGLARREATLEACRLRLRPILMTAFAFILGVYPLVVAAGAGWEMQQSLGIAVFSGMIGVTFFGIFLTPVFYYVITGVVERKTPSGPPAPDGSVSGCPQPTAETGKQPTPSVVEANGEPHAPSPGKTEPQPPASSPP